MDTAAALAMAGSNLWGIGVADEVLFPTETVLFVGQIIGVVSTDNPDIGASAAAESEEQGRGCDEQEITVHFERHGPSGLQEKRASVLGIPQHRVIVKVRYDLKHTRGSEDEFYYMYNLSVGELAVVFAERRLGWRLGVPLMAGGAAEEPKK